MGVLQAIAHNFTGRTVPLSLEVRAWSNYHGHCE